MAPAPPTPDTGALGDSGAGTGVSVPWGVTIMVPASEPVPLFFTGISGSGSCAGSSGGVMTVGVTEVPVLPLLGFTTGVVTEGASSEGVTSEGVAAEPVPLEVSFGVSAWGFASSLFDGVVMVPAEPPVEGAFVTGAAAL